MPTLIKKRSGVINGHQTSVSMEDVFWEELRRIAERRGTSANGMLAVIDKARHLAGVDSLSSFIRCYVLQDALERADAVSSATAHKQA